MEFLLLGPVQARHAGRLVLLGARKQRLVLAVLCLEANRQVSVERLVRLLWPGDPPATARGMIQSYVSGLRSILNRAGVDPADIRLETGGPGYLLRCDAARIDVHRFHALLAEARECADDGQRLDLLEGALALWRGPALSGTASEDLQDRLCTGLDEARMSALEDLFDVRLRLGTNDVGSGGLREFAMEHLHRPRLAGALMLALHRAGRSAEALGVYQAARRRLDEESGGWTRNTGSNRHSGCETCWSPYCATIPLCPYGKTPRDGSRRPPCPGNCPPT